MSVLDGIRLSKILLRPVSILILTSLSIQFSPFSAAAAEKVFEFTVGETTNQVIARPIANSIVTAHGLTTIFLAIAVLILISIVLLQSYLTNVRPKRLAQVLVDSIPDGAAISNFDRALYYVNQHACTMFGYSKEELRGLRLSEVLTPDSNRRNKDFRREIIQNRFDQENPTDLKMTELEGIRRDGSTFSFQVTMTSKKIGNHEFVISVFRETTRQRALEKELKDRGRFLETVLNTMTDVVFIIDNRGIIVDCSDASFRTFGYTKDELISQNISVLMDTEDRSSHDQYIDHYLSSRKPKILGKQPREVIGKTKTGESLYLELMVNEMVTGDQHLFVGSLRDVSVRKALEGEIQKAQKLQALGSLAAGIAHNFNNILTPIMALSETMLDNGPEDARSKKRLEIIHIASQRGSKLVAEIMKVGGDDDTHDHVMSDLRELTEDTIMLIENGLPGNIKIERYIDAGPFTVYGDQSAIQSILLNILQNAVYAIGDQTGDICISTLTYHTDQEERIGVFTIQPGNYICIEIADSGPGMDGEVLDRIFEPFFTTKEPGEGTGLGLSTAATIVEAHGGALKAESEPGEGTSFTMIFPRMIEEEGSEIGISLDKRQELDFVEAEFGGEKTYEKIT